MKRTIKLLLTVWVVLMLALLGFYLNNARRYKPTGDELYDRTARWILSQRSLFETPNRTELFINQHIRRGPVVTLDVETPLGWEAEFGDDPRYWQLLAQLQKIDDAIYYIANENGLTYNWAGYRLSESELRDLRDRLTFDEATYSMFSFNPSAFTPSECSPADLEEAITKALSLVDDAIASNPDNSYFYYEKAHLLLNLGEWEQAWDNIKSGNGTPQNSRPLPFPRSCVLEHGSEFTGANCQLAATLFSVDYSLPNYINIKERFKEVACLVAWGAPLELADDYLTCARRMAQMDNQDTLGQTNAQVLAEAVLLEYLVENCLELDPGQAEEYQLIKQQLARVAADRQAVTSRRWPALNNVTDPYLIQLNGFRAADWEGELELAATVETGKAYFEILDPPPLAAWGRGELAGVDVDTGQADIDTGE